MNVIVNGIAKKFQNETCLGDLIAQLELDEKVMAAAVNMEIVKKEK